MRRRQQLLGPIPHTILRIVFVAIDRTHVYHSVTPSRHAQGLELTADTARYLHALVRRSVGPLPPWLNIPEESPFKSENPCPLLNEELRR